MHIALCDIVNNYLNENRSLQLSHSCFCFHMTLSHEWDNLLSFQYHFSSLKNERLAYYKSNKKNAIRRISERRGDHGSLKRVEEPQFVELVKVKGLMVLSNIWKNRPEGQKYGMFLGKENVPTDFFLNHDWGNILGLCQECQNCTQVRLAVLNIWLQQANRNNEEEHRFKKWMWYTRNCKII